MISHKILDTCDTNDDDDNKTRGELCRVCNFPSFPSLLLFKVRLGGPRGSGEALGGYQGAGGPGG